jgi:hypothetical protein
MSEKRFRDYSEIAQWAIVILGMDKIDEIKSAGEGYEVFITINGVEVDFESIVKSINDQYHKAVTEEAKEILPEAIKDKVGEITNILLDIKDSAYDLSKSIEKEIGWY